jgi:hypothetical protein
VLSSLIEFSGNLVFVSSNPLVVVSKHAVNRPFIVGSINNSFLPFVFSTLQPIWF